jgi:hypothetical protein
MKEQDVAKSETKNSMSKFFWSWTDFLNNFASKFGEKIGLFYTKNSQFNAEKVNFFAENWGKMA